eukprot:gene15740-20219_t
MPGCCRGPDAFGAGDFNTYTSATQDACEEACTSLSSCSAYEYTVGKVGCEIHTGNVIRGNDEVGCNCYRKMSSETVPPPTTTTPEPPASVNCLADKYVAVNGYNIVGKALIKSVDNLDLDACADACKAEIRCLSFSFKFKANTPKCRLGSSGGTVTSEWAANANFMYYVEHDVCSKNRRRYV